GAALTIEPAAHRGDEAIARDHRVGTAADLDLDAGDLDVEGSAQSLGRLQLVEERRQPRGEAATDRNDDDPHVADDTEVVRNAAHSVAIRADFGSVAWDTGLYGSDRRGHEGESTCCTGPSCSQPALPWASRVSASPARRRGPKGQGPTAPSSTCLTWSPVSPTSPLLATSSIPAAAPATATAP